MKDWKRFEDALKNKVQKEYPVDEALWASAQADLDAHFPAKQGKRGFAWFMLTTIVSITSIVGYVLSKPNTDNVQLPLQVAVVEQDNNMKQPDADKAIDLTAQTIREEVLNPTTDLETNVQDNSKSDGVDVTPNQDSQPKVEKNPENKFAVADGLVGNGGPKTGGPIVGDRSDKLNQTAQRDEKLLAGSTTDGQIRSNNSDVIRKSWPNDALVEAMAMSWMKSEGAFKPAAPKKASGSAFKPRKLFTYSIEADYTHTPWLVMGDSSGESTLAGSFKNEITSARSAQIKFNARWKKLEVRAGIGRSVFNNQLVVNQRGFVRTHDTTFHNYRVIDSSFDAGNREVWLIQTEYEVLTQSRPIDEEVYNQTDQIRYWNIPLSLSYVQPIKRFELGVNLGVNVLLSPTTASSYMTSDTTAEALKPYSGINRTLVQNDLSMRLGYRANYHTMIYAEARNTWLGKHLFSSTSYAYRSRGVTVGINYRF